MGNNMAGAEYDTDGMFGDGYCFFLFMSRLFDVIQIQLRAKKNEGNKANRNIRIVFVEST